MDYQEASRELQGRCKNRRKVANNTYLERRDGDAIAVRLHDTDVITLHPDGRVTLDTGGWKTVTTKERFNRFTDARVYSDKGIWYAHGWGTVPFADGLTRCPDGTVAGAGPDPRATLKLRKRIKQFAKDYIRELYAGNVPRPGAGDCFYCGMTVCDGPDKGRGLGESTRNEDHILSHLDENYFVPSLLARAAKRFGVSRAALTFLWGGCWADDTVDPGTRENCLSWGGVKTLAANGSRDPGRDVVGDQLRKALQRYLYEQTGSAS